MFPPIWNPEVIRQWVLQGIPWRKGTVAAKPKCHGEVAVPPKKPTVFEVSRANSARNPIDALILGETRPRDQRLPRL